MTDISEAVNRQLDRNAAANLLYAHVEDLIQLDPTFLAAIEELLLKGSQSLPEKARIRLVSLTTKALLQKIWSINQFIHVTDADKGRLEAIYSETWKRLLQTSDITNCLREYHYPELGKWLGQLYPKEYRTVLSSSSAIGHVVCEEYPPELQVKLLRLEYGQLISPVLDVGCGKNAQLVMHMRSLGIEAFGIDRTVGMELDYIKEADWLHYEFERDTWGTVVANLSFTNHFVYVQQYDEARTAIYKRKFVEIAASLKERGTFVYAPGAPSLEGELNTDQFKVESWTGFRGYTVTKVTRSAL
jgi:hypothetical protein